MYAFHGNEIVFLQLRPTRVLVDILSPPMFPTRFVVSRVTPDLEEIKRIAWLGDVGEHFTSVLEEILTALVMGTTPFLPAGYYHLHVRERQGQGRCLDGRPISFNERAITVNLPDPTADTFYFEIRGEIYTLILDRPHCVLGKVNLAQGTGWRAEQGGPHKLEELIRTWFTDPALKEFAMRLLASWLVPQTIKVPRGLWCTEKRNLLHLTGTIPIPDNLMTWDPLEGTNFVPHTKAIL